MALAPGLIGLFGRGRSIGSPIIRAADRWGQWSHCSLLVPDRGYVIEAVAFKGVIRTPLDEFAERMAKFERKEIACPYPDDGIEWAEQQVGKGYDYGALLGNLLREDIEDRQRLDCAELLEGAVVRAGRIRFTRELWKLSPNLSYIVV